ncbi:AraC family transcriptional regulator [Streptomyces chryseus]
MCHPSWGRARAAAQHLSDLARLRRVRDRIDREYARPLNVEALARGADMPAGQLSRQFRLAYGKSPHAYVSARRTTRFPAPVGLPPCTAKPVTGPVRNEEAPDAEPQLA